MHQKYIFLIFNSFEKTLKMPKTMQIHQKYICFWILKKKARKGGQNQVMKIVPFFTIPTV
jgi:hypothetical protein